MMSSVKISVAMATYNGEKYLQAQLDSLSQQEYLPHELVVGDDGSTDRTVEILERFAEKAPFPVQLTVNRHNLGYAENFLQTASRCNGKWIAFCDQDDVWLSNKLKLCANAIDANPGLNMILQNSEICDGSLGSRGRRFPDSIKPGVYPRLSQFGFWVWPGFLKTIRASLIKEIDFDQRPISYFPKDVRQTHDKWTCMIANALGGVCVQGESVALYRRHDDALTGNYESQSLSQRISKANAVSEDHYFHLSRAALDSARYLFEAAEDAPNASWASMLKDAAHAFIDLSLIQDKRAALYSSDSRSERIRIYASLWARVGYFGPSFKALGWRSAVKDAIAVVRKRSISA